MPEALRQLIALTPFGAIMHTPVAIYLGRLDGAQAGPAILGQIGWAVALYLVGEIAFARGARRIVIQGG
jgi:ABC-2 type transport system permease protein